MGDQGGPWRRLLPSPGGLLGAVAGGAAFALLVPLPVADSATWGTGTALSVEAHGVAWWCAVLAYAVFGWATVRLTAIDLRERRLPNRWVAGVSVSTLGLLTLSSLLQGQGWGLCAPWFTVIVWAAAAGALWWWCPESIGGGDLKLMPVAAYASVWLLPREAWWSGPLVFGALLGAGLLLSGGLALARGRKAFAAAPAMFAAAWGGVVVAALLAR